jgi:hypothetical protein
MLPLSPSSAGASGNGIGAALDLGDIRTSIAASRASTIASLRAFEESKH